MLSRIIKNFELRGEIVNGYSSSYLFRLLRPGTNIGLRMLLAVIRSNNQSWNDIQIAQTISRYLETSTSLEWVSDVYFLTILDLPFAFV